MLRKTRKNKLIFLLQYVKKKCLIYFLLFIVIDSIRLTNCNSELKYKHNNNHNNNNNNGSNISNSNIGKFNNNTHIYSLITPFNSKHTDTTVNYDLNNNNSNNNHNNKHNNNYNNHNNHTNNKNININNSSKIKHYRDSNIVRYANVTKRPTIHEISDTSKIEVYDGIDIIDDHNTSEGYDNLYHPNIFQNSHTTMTNPRSSGGAGSSSSSSSSSGSSSSSSSNSNSDSTSTSHITSCNACRLREELKSNSLSSIQAHVLQKLGFTNPPNITRENPPPPVPESIIKDFYNSTGYPYYRKSKWSEDNYERYNNDGDRDEPMMMSDDPNIYATKFQPSEEIVEEDDDYYSVTEKIYAFPTIKKIRHNRDILVFRFANIEHTMVSKAILNLYFRGTDELQKNQANIQSTTGNRKFSLSINRVVRTTTQPEKTLSRTEGEYQYELQSGEGRTVQIDVTSMASEWFQSPQNNQGMIIKLDQLGKKIVVIDANENGRKNGPYIEIVTRDTRKRRTKRNVELNCVENDRERRCCRYPLIIDFERFGWDWIIAPKTYEANYCAGECLISFLPRYSHTHLMQLSSSVQPCCSPRRMSPLKLLYFDKSYNVVHTKLPNMIVEKCACA